jgi:multidrug efflux pump subunit AcrB
VVRRVREALPAFRAAVPDDINVSFAFDQSFYVTDALGSLRFEGMLGALLTGATILLLLGSLRSALVVVMTIPLALLSAVVALWAAGQSINLMTLGGLTLAIGILVDESVIAIENIHRHLDGGKPVARAVLEASREVVIPRLLIMLCMLAVFAPSFFMAGVARAMFVPLALSVGFAMASSYFLASSFVPILETWWNRRRGPQRSGTVDAGTAAGHSRDSWFERLRSPYGALSCRIVRFRWPVTVLYLAAAGAILFSAGSKLGTEIFPRTDPGMLQMRLRAATGTRVERTEVIAQDVLNAVSQEVGPENVETSLAFVGVQPSSYPVNLIFLWTGGPHEAILLIDLKAEAGISTAELQERLRQRLPEVAPGVSVTFEAADLVGQVMSFGAPTPIEIAVAGADLEANRSYAGLIVEKLRSIGSLRDVQLGELLDSPTLAIEIDRERAAQLGVTVSDVGRALAPATWSSRFTTPVYWADPKSGIAYQVQVETPQARIASIEDVAGLPVKANHVSPTLLRDVATVAEGRAYGEYHRNNMQRMITVNANVTGADLGSAAREIASALKALPEAPRGVSVSVRGQAAPLSLMVDNLELGLSLSVVAVFLLLAAYFQSLRIAFAILMAIPAVLAGVSLALLAAGMTLNIQSFMGAMMAIGISVANSILLCAFADQYRREGRTSVEAAVEASRSRLRPILMTSIVMISGMVPMALGTAQTAPLAIAVIGGLLASTLTTLLVIPSVFAIVEQKTATHSPSMDPDDPASRYYDGAALERTPGTV